MEESAVNKPVYTWLLTTGLLAFGLFLLWWYGIIHAIIDQDKTRLSMVILALFLGTCAYLGVAASRLTRLSRQILLFSRTGESKQVQDPELQQVLVSHSLENGNGGQGQSLHAWLVEKIHRGHSLGWFMSESLIRLGLIGTVIGFIIMLGSVYGLEDRDVNTLKDLLGSMGGGMQVALYTTLTGISCSLVLNLYCRNMDRCADDLVGRIIYICLAEESGKSDAEPV